MATFEQLVQEDTFVTIANRLARFSPSIDIKSHIHSGLEVGRDTLHGISFVAKDPERLKRELRNTVDVDGLQAFAWGHKEDKEHWALAKSFSATHGIGFREIWRPRLTRKAISLADLPPDHTGVSWRSRKPRESMALPEYGDRFAPQWDRGSAARFGDSLTMPDMSSVHCAVAPDVCNIHIDEMGFVVEGLNGELALTPDFLRHLLIELLWKTDARKVLPNIVVDHLNFIIPSSLNNYSVIGASLDAQISKNVRVSLSWTVPLKGSFEHTTTLTVSGTHNIFGSK